MKKFITLLIFLFYCSYANSQVLISLLFGDKLNTEGVEFGLDGGLSFSNISGLQETNYLGSFNLGFYFDFQLKKSPFSLRTGMLMKSTKGSKNLSSGDLLKIDPGFQFDKEDEYSQRIGYFELPVLLRYKFKCNFYVELGGQAGLMNKAFVLYQNSEGDRQESVKTDNIDLMNRIDVGVLSGLGYRLMKGQGVTLGIWYYQGMVNVYQSIHGSTNSSITFKLMIPVGANKKSKNKEE